MEAVVGTIGFLGACEGKPAALGHRVDRSRLPIENHPVRIEAHSVEHPRSLDREGVIVLSVEGLPRTKDVFLGAVGAHLQRVSGAKEVCAINAVIRRSERSASFGKDGTTVPGRFAHTDFNGGELGAAFWIERLVPSAQVSSWLTARHAIYNLWRPLSAPPFDVPLAFCDPRSVKAEDLVATDCVGHLPEDVTACFEMNVLRFDPAQRWCYFPDLRSDSLLIFKGFDSDSRRASLVPHAAFDDATCRPRGAPRESIEARFLARF